MKEKGCHKRWPAADKIAGTADPELLKSRMLLLLPQMTACRVAEVSIVLVCYLSLYNQTIFFISNFKN
jgi:hypothetical protein